MTLVILLGFPKSGTSSFQKLFSDLGYKSYHWNSEKGYVGVIIRENITSGRKPFSGFYSDDDEDVAFTQMDICVSPKENVWPQMDYLNEIYEEYPHAVYILNYRKPERIAKSFRRWGDLMPRFRKYNSHLFLDKNEENNDFEFEGIVYTHFENVNRFFSEKDAKFVVYDIENDELEKISKYVDIKGITRFPHENKNKSLQRQASI